MKTKLYLTLLLILQAYFGFAQPGEIDNSFNSSGIGAYGGATALPAVDATADGIVYKTDVYAASSIHKDKIIIIGRFSSYNGVQRKKIARLNADGTLDTTFNTAYFTTASGGDYLYCVKILPDNKILIGGSFSIGVYRNIARLNEDGTIDNTFNVVTPSTAVRGTNGPVHAICLQSDNKILIGGDYVTFNGTGNRKLLRLNADGSLDTTFNTTGTPNGEIRAIAIQKNGTNANKILVGGFFDGFTDYANKGHLIRVLPNGDLDTTFNPGGTGVTGGSAVFDIIVKPDSDSFFAVGKFSSYNGTPRNSIVFLSNNGTTLMSTIGTGNGETIFSAKFQPDGKVLLGGNFKAFAGVTIPKGITRISIVVPTAPATPYILRDATFLTGTGFTGGTGVYEGVSVIRDLVLQSDGKIIVSGDYTVYDGTPRRMIARIKTRECPYAAVYDNGIWKDGIAINSTTTQYYMNVSSGTLTIPTGSNFNACELEIKDGAKLIIQPGASLTVNGIVMNNGEFQLENTASLVQTKEDTKNADLGAGIFTMKRNTSNLKPYDFVYWSSPVEDQTLHNLSPLTRADKYYKFDTNLNNWVEINGGYTIMEEGKGYIARAPSNQIAGQTFEAGFIGRPHNGTITFPIVKNGSSIANLIGNPYPSAIDASAFLNDPLNVTKINGAVYLWSHQTAISNSTSGSYQNNYSSSDYIVYNKLGSTLTDPTGTLFNGKIAAGQAFFIEALSSSTITFKNTMRMVNNNAQFYKNEAAAVQTTSSNRLWLDLSNAEGAFKQTLVGFAEGATAGLDRDFDAVSMEGNSFVDFYSLYGTQKMTIQGLPMPFNESQVIPLGYVSSVAGAFKISLHQFDGLFDSQNVYLVDKLLNTVQDIKTVAYTFNTAAGTFNNRFEIKFTNGATLGLNDMEIKDNSALILAESNKVSVKSSENIDSITVYDLTGKVLYNKQGIDALTYSTENLNVQNQVILVLVKMNSGKTLTKKVIL